MKIVVDEIPVYVMDCPFAIDEDGSWACTLQPTCEHYGVLKHDICSLTYGMPCKMLVGQQKETKAPAHWVGDEHTCSECGRSLLEMMDGYSDFRSDFDFSELVACPWCGTRMK